MPDTEPTYPRILYQTDAAHEQAFVPEAVEPPPDPEPPDPTPGPSQACLIIECQGVAHSFIPEEGEELDPYTDPLGAFTQRNILCRNGDLPDLIVFYRPDAHSNREEWVIELGETFTTHQANMPAYAAVITDQAGHQHRVEAPSGHYWFCRWRWQSERRPVRTGYETLAAQGLIPHLDTDGLADGPLQTVSDYKPMATCGFPSNQSQTGGYPGLGIITGWQAQYLVRGAPEETWRDQAEAGNSYRVFVRDPNTYSPMDIVNVWPTAGMYSSKDNNPYIPKGPSPNITDQGHLPSTFYVPFLLTGDPYYLEAMQYTCNYQQLSLPSHSRVMVAARYWAWPLRAVTELVACCPAIVPSWLLPKSYWEHWLGVFKGHITDRMNNQADPYYYVFHSIWDNGQNTNLDPAKSGDHVWQQNFVCLVTAWLATWRDDWTDQAEWSIQSAIARASATSGWVRAHPSPYHMRLSHTSVLNRTLAKADTELELQYPQLGFASGVQVKIDNEVMTLRDRRNDAATLWSVTRAQGGTVAADHPSLRAVYGPKYLSWCEAASGNVETYDWTNTQDNAHLSPNTTDLTYPSYQRAALAQALTAGLDVPGLKEAYDWLDAEIRHWHSEEGLGVGDNWAVVPMTKTRRHHRRSDASDPQLRAELLALIEEANDSEVTEHATESL